MKYLAVTIALFVALSVSAQSLTVHEWGTFTTLRGSDGGTLSGLYFEEEQLPDFVYRHAGFSPDSTALSGNPRPCKGVTVKMETPVLYFYSNVERNVRVHVDFPHGTISQWYPQRSGGEANPLGDTVDLTIPQTGSIDWNATILSPTSTEPYTEYPTNKHKWTDPRATDANLVQNHTNEVEKYLFYRGLANFELPLEARFLNDTTLYIKNSSPLDIPFFYVYDRTKSFSVGVWGIGPLHSGKDTILTRPKEYIDEDFGVKENADFANALMASGLTSKEAMAMLRTWQDGYFLTSGFKIFWIVPRELTDEILPIDITPQPDTLVRVLVGKTEILTPMAEKQMLNYYKKNKENTWPGDKYRIAFGQRCEELLQEEEEAKRLSVHEWGTFTTLKGSDGGTLSGLYIEEEPLLPFVYHHPGFSPDSIIQTNGYRPVKDATVKMETPVLYFYSQNEKSAKVHVDFPNGTISQWYPERSGGEVTPTSDTIDLGKPMTGSIDWDITVLAPDTKETYTENQNINLKWYHPRQTDANLIKNHIGQVEKYLFYRGLANFSLPVEVKWLEDGTLKVQNTSLFNIPFIYIYDHSDISRVGIWGIGPLAAGETQTFKKPTEYYGYDQGTPEYNNFRQALQDAGLTYKEAEAMLQTWTDGYFQTEGFKVFWVVPRELTDKILPINISPTPDSLERVLVGKSEIMTPALEAELITDYKTGNMDKWSNHHYYQAFMQRIEQLSQLSVKQTSSGSHYTLAPNPATSYTHIYGNESAMMSISIRNPLGVEVLNTVTSGALDTHSLTSGMYFVTITANSKSETLKLIKE